jgi:hypothetical protein
VTDKYFARLQKFKGKRVYYFDDIPCIVHKVKYDRDYLQVEVIENDLHTTRMAFIVYKGGEIAHGDTLEEAENAALEKYYSGKDFEELAALFISTCPSLEQKEKVSDLYRWHGLLTGSCKFGRDRWMRERSLTFEDEMTVGEFLSIPDFNSERLLRVKNKIINN